MNHPATTLLGSLCLASLAGPVLAEPGGSLAGRGGDPEALPELSVELGYRKPEDGSYIGARVNYRFDERVTLYGDFGMGELEGDPVPANGDGVTAAEADGNTFGVGVFYHLPDVADGFDVSVQASYHAGTLDGSGAIVTDQDDTSFRFVELEEIDVTALYAGVLVSAPEPLSANGLSWYGALGYGKVDFETTIRNNPTTIDDDTSAAVIEAGLVLPLASGQLYGGYESFDGDGDFGVGFRYFFR